jgi:uncharacterized membrane protein YraQ (UPF0718 family)
MSSSPLVPDPRAPRSGLVTALMIIAGILMLLPGLCSIFGIMVIRGLDPQGAQDPGMIALWVACFAISIAGILLLRRALRG